MNRISGIEKSQAPWHLRWFYTTMRKMFGKDLTPVKQHMRLFSDVEKLVIELADAMVETPSNVSDDLYARLREKFSEEQLLQLGGQIAFENFRARLNRVFDVGSDELYNPRHPRLNSS